MATTLSPVSGDPRAVLRCDFCGMVQFPTSDDNCRRCHRPFDEPAAIPSPVPAPMPPTRASQTLAQRLRELRLRAGLSQRELAKRIGPIPRTYVSKIENEKATPTIPSLERLAQGLQCSVGEIVGCLDQGRQAAAAELLADPFLAEITPFVSRLTPAQMSDVLRLVRDLPSRRLARAS